MLKCGWFTVYQHSSLLFIIISEEIERGDGEARVGAPCSSDCFLLSSGIGIFGVLLVLTNQDTLSNHEPLTLQLEIGTIAGSLFDWRFFESVTEEMYRRNWISRVQLVKAGK